MKITFFTSIYIIFIPFSIYLQQHNLDIRIKSHRGWMRIISSQEKRKEYHLDLNTTQIDEYLKELKKMDKKDKEGGLL